MTSQIAPQSSGSEDSGKVLGQVESTKDSVKDLQPEPTKDQNGTDFGSVAKKSADETPAQTQEDIKDALKSVGKTIDDDGNVLENGKVVGKVQLDSGKPSDPEMTEEEKEKKAELDQIKKKAKQIGDIIGVSLDKIKPILEMINNYMVRAEGDQRNNKLNEEELVKNVRPLIEQGSNILNETNGAIRALDPEGKVATTAKNHSRGHEASPEEYYLAEKLTELTEKVQKTIDGAKMKIQDMPHAKKELSPLLLALQNPLVQIVSAVGLLLAGVLGLVRQLLGGLGLGGLVDNLLGAVGLDKLVDSIGLGPMFGKK